MLNLGAVNHGFQLIYFKEKLKIIERLNTINQGYPIWWDGPIISSELPECRPIVSLTARAEKEVKKLASKLH